MDPPEPGTVKVRVAATHCAGVVVITASTVGSPAKLTTGRDGADDRHDSVGSSVVNPVSVPADVSAPVGAVVARVSVTGWPPNCPV